MPISPILMRLVAVVAAIGALSTLPGSAFGQLSTKDLQDLRARAAAEGWTFIIRENEATKKPLSSLCGTIIPPDHVEPAPDPTLETADLPAAFDWREHNAVTPVRDQDGCGSCWAFAAVGAAENVFKLNLGLDLDLSEQWLMDCTSAGSCNGGKHYEALTMMSCARLGDDCGHCGAVLEADAPYLGPYQTCGCPYAHPYCLQGRLGVANSVASIKTAIYNKGAVCTTMNVNLAF